MVVMWCWMVVWCWWQMVLVADGVNSRWCWWQLVLVADGVGGI